MDAGGRGQAATAGQPPWDSLGGRAYGVRARRIYGVARPADDSQRFVVGLRSTRPAGTGREGLPKVRSGLKILSIAGTNSRPRSALAAADTQVLDNETLPLLRGQSIGRLQKRNWASRLLLPAALFVVAFGIGTYVVRAYRASGGVQDFYQSEFGPAVMLACGRGYHPPDATMLPQLMGFLRLELDRFDCASLPAQVPLKQALNSVQPVSRYLEMSVAATWWIVGVSWSRLAVFGGLLLAAVVTLSYGLARVALSPLWSLAVAVPLLWSPLGLSILPHYRDYAKAPFVLALVLLMARLVVGPGRVGTLLGLAALGGGIAGIGLGFRNDMLITIVPFLIVLLALAPVASSRGWLVRAGAAGVFAFAFVVVARPVLADYSEGSNTGHVILLGLTEPFDA